MSATDLPRVRLLYDSFAHACELAGYRAYLPHRSTDPELHSEISDSVVINNDLRELTASEIVVAYLGEPSLGVGAEIAISMHQGKRILAVYESGKRISRFLSGLLAAYPKASICEYDSVLDVCAWITNKLMESASELPGQVA